MYPFFLSAFIVLDFGNGMCYHHQVVGIIIFIINDIDNRWRCKV